MRVLIASKTLTITKALRAFAKEQVEKLNKLQQRISKVQVFLDHRSSNKLDENALVKYVVSLPGKTVVIKRQAHDMYQALVDGADRAVRQVRKLKEKRLDQTRSSR